MFFSLSAAPSLPEVESTLSDIFSRPEFSRKEGLLGRLLRIITEFLRNIGIRIGEEEILSRLVVFLGAAVLIGILVALVLYFTRNLRKGARADERASPAGHASSLEEAMRLSESAERRGDYTWALVYLFIAYLYELNGGGKIRLADGKTNRQYRYELRAASYPDIDKFEDFSRDYAGARFGGLAPGEDRFLKWKRAYPSLVRKGVGA
ncbi:hypothetical protein LJC34_06500 [Oscillospiraceae bacterium OttesenSCG-928-G22]|nr:hypothetical protein [Oscillospiraceae bacterium OttesenSCG-928-G22]